MSTPNMSTPNKPYSHPKYQYKWQDPEMIRRVRNNTSLSEEDAVFCLKSNVCKFEWQKLRDHSKPGCKRKTTCTFIHPVKNPNSSSSNPPSSSNPSSRDYHQHGYHHQRGYHHHHQRDYHINRNNSNYHNPPTDPPNNYHHRESKRTSRRESKRNHRSRRESKRNHRSRSKSRSISRNKNRNRNRSRSRSRSRRKRNKNQNTNNYNKDDNDNNDRNRNKNKNKNTNNYNKDDNGSISSQINDNQKDMSLTNIWKNLSAAEICRFGERQLIKHGDGAPAADLILEMINCATKDETKYGLKDCYCLAAQFLMQKDHEKANDMIRKAESIDGLYYKTDILRAFVLINKQEFVKAADGLELTKRRIANRTLYDLDPDTEPGKKRLNEIDKWIEDIDEKIKKVTEFINLFLFICMSV